MTGYKTVLTCDRFRSVVVAQTGKVWIQEPTLFKLFKKSIASKSRRFGWARIEVEMPELATNKKSRGGNMAKHKFLAAPLIVPASLFFCVMRRQGSRTPIPRRPYIVPTT